MALPMTYNEAVEAEALRFAHELIESHRQPRGIFHPDAEHLYGRIAMKCFAVTHPFGADDIVYLAEQGSPEADYALREIIVEAARRGAGRL